MRACLLTNFSPISNSCTILVDDKPICIRDDNQWKNCTNGHDPADFVRTIQAAYDRRNDLKPASLVDEMDPAQLVFQKRDLQTVPMATAVYRRQAPNTTTAAPSSTDPNATNTASPGGGLGLFGGGGNGQPANPASVFVSLRSAMPTKKDCMLILIPPCLFQSRADVRDRYVSDPRLHSFVAIHADMTPDPHSLSSLQPSHYLSSSSALCCCASSCAIVA